MFIAILVIIVIAAIIYGISSSVSANKEYNAAADNNKKVLDRMHGIYGEPTAKIYAPCYSNPTAGSFHTDIHNQVLVYEPLKKISLKGKMYDFSQITGYSVSVNNQIVSSNTKTSTGSALGRAAVGGVLLGGVGAIIGASTAKTTTEYTTQDKTSINIYTNSLSEPSILLDLINPTKEMVAQIEGVLRIITTTEETSATPVEPSVVPTPQIQETAKKNKFNIGDIATLKKDKREIVIIDIIAHNDKVLYQGDGDTCYYSEDDLE